MDSDPKTFFQDLNLHLKDDTKGPCESSRLLDSLNRSFTEEQIDPSLIDTYLIYIFHTSDGLLKFIEASVKNKAFKKASKNAVELLFTIINNFPSKVPERDILSIYTLSTKIVNSDTDYLVKGKLFELVHLCMEKYDACTDNAKVVLEALLKGILHALMQKHTDTVKGKEMAILGCFAKKFPYYIDEPKKILQIFWTNFEVQMAQTKNISQYILSGFFEGFGYFVESFPLDTGTHDGKKISEKLYNVMKTLVVINKFDKMKIGNRAALLFFAKNIDIYRNKLLEDYAFWHSKLLSWLTFGPEEKKVGVTVLRAFFQTVAQLIDEKEEHTFRNVVKHFNNYSKNVLETKESSNYEKHSAIFCLRQFAAPSYKHLPTEEVTSLFLAIMHNFEETFILNYDSESEESEYLPDYVQTVANFMRFKKFTAGELFCLQRAMINLIKSFHRLPILHFGVVVDSFVMTLFYLKESHQFDVVLENVIYQGVVWTCSHQHISNEAYSEEVLQKIVTVRNYFPLWNGLLKFPSNTSYDKHKLHLEGRKYLLERIVKELVKTLLVLVNKLNVCVRPKEEEEVVTDLERAYRVDEMNDYAIFLNVVDFYREMFENVDPKMMRGCICRLISHFVDKCLKYPLVSGFYKLLSYTLRIAKKLELFSGEGSEIMNCQETLNTFLAIMLNKMVEFKDELSISCLQVLLEAPVVVIEEMLELCVIPFVNIFEMGKSYLPLARMGLDTLEFWQENMDPAVLDPVLIRIIPSLDTFLRSKSLRGFAPSTVERRKTKRALKKRKVVVELEPELVKLQRKILCFVGKQNLKNLRAYIFSESTGARNLICGQESYLKVTLPYEDMQVDVYLDTFVPRIVDLASHCSDRKTRITACELLQAVVMVLLGKAKPMNQSGLLELNNLLKTIAMPLLLLSSDVDQVVQQIFAPLFLQLVHWYTSPTQQRGAHSAIIVEALMEGITHPTNSSLRDFSGKCVREFVIWTIKQSDEHNLARDPVNIKILVKNMRFFSAHPDSAKKLGAALIFNNIYRELREEEAILSIFWLEILHIILQSLNSITALEESTAVAQLKLAAKNLQRVLVEKPSVFRRSDPKRRVPNDLGAGLLIDAAGWLLKQTASKSKHCRKASMELFISVAPLAIDNKTKLRTFIRESFHKPLTDLYKASLLAFDGADTGNPEGLFKWMRGLLCTVDGYNFVARNNLGDLDFEDDSLFDEVQVFLRRLQAVELADALNDVVSQKTWTFTAIDKDLFGSLKAACGLSILKLFNTLLNDEVLLEKSAGVRTVQFFKLISNAVFNPRSLGLNEVGYPDYKGQLLLLVNSIPRKLPESELTQLCHILRTVFLTHGGSNFDLRGHVGLSKRSFMEGMVFLQGTRLGSLLSIDNQRKGLVEKLMSSFSRCSDGDVIFVGDIQDTTFSYIHSLLEFALCNETEFEVMVEHLHSRFVIQSMEYAKEKSFGVYFLSTFEDTLLPIIVSKFERFLIASLAENNLKTSIDLVSLVLNYLLKEKSLRIYGKDIANILEQYWRQFQVYFETDQDTMNTGLDYLKLLAQLDDLHMVEVQDWLIQYLLKSEGNNDLEVFNLLVLTAAPEIDNSQNFKSALQSLADRTLLESIDINTTKVNKMLSYWPLVRSTTIFRFLADIFVRTSSTIDISPLLTKFITKQDTNVQQNILEMVYELSCNSQTPFDNRYKVTTKLIPPVFQGCDLNVFENFFVRHIKNFLSGTNLEIHIPHFVLIEILFLRIPIGAKDREECAISNASGSPKLLRHLLATTLKVFELPIEESPLSRKFKCHAYNALASMVSNSLRLKDFYNKLFLRVVDDADVLWRGIVDTAVAYEFPVDFDTIPTRRKVLVNIRDELKRNRRPGGPSKSLRYIESQRLFASSLSEDVTDFDFTNSVLRDKAKHEEVGEADDGQRTVLQLDATEINEHECMGTVCGLIQHIFDTEISDLPREDEDDVELPKWMDGIRTTLLNKNTHNNVKIFLVKVIDNMMDTFSHYSKWFLEPLMLFITNKCAGEVINYFVTDVLIILSKWASIMTNLSEKEEQIASDLLKFLIENLERGRVDIFKYNLDIIKMIVEAWKNHLVVPKSTIFQLLTSEDKSDIGVNVTSVLLVNGLRCWDEGKEMEFLEVLLKKLKSPKKEVYRPCAETVGLMLHLLQDDQFTARVDLSLKRANLEYEKYVLCLEGIVRHFPQIVDSFHMSRLINPLNQVPDPQKVVHLRIICKRVELSLNILTEISDFKMIDWDQLIESASLEIQIVALEIIKKCVTIFVKYDNFKNICKTLTRNVANPNALYRSCLYDICIEVYNLKRDDSGACREMLILGLVDTDADNNDKVMKFWSDNTSLPSTVILRFPFLLSEMYKSKIEGRFLGFVSYFLTSLTSRSALYDADLFEHPLEDCDFEAYRLQTDWRLQHPSMVPMFAETLAQSCDADADDSGVAFRLRGTQDTMEFAPTQSLRERQLSQFTDLSSSLAVAFDEGIKNPNTMILSQKYRIPRRRFLKDKSKISISHAHYEVKKQVKKFQQRIDSAVEKEKKVTIYRSYRKGDFPDIQITLSAVLKPLQMLALHDNEVSKILFSEIFKGLVDKAGNNQSFVEAITNAIKSIFTSSTQYNPNLFGALFDILLRHKDKIKFDPQTVAYVSQESGLVAVGALLIEEYINGYDGSPSCSKIGVGRDNKETMYWVKLAELYRELGEWDMVRTIFLEKMNCKEAVQGAIKFESESMFRNAQLLYQQLIETDISPERKDFYYDSYFRCFANLGEWEDLPKVISSVVGGDNAWHQLWDNGWQQQKLLPWYIKAQVRHTLFSQEWNPDFLKDVNDSLSDSDRNEYLRGHFSEELCAMWLCQKDVPTADFYLKSSIRNFLEEWQLLNPMFQPLRFQKLLQLQNVIETEEFLNIYRHLLDDPEVSLAKYTKRLQKSSAEDVLPSVLLNESRLLYRSQFVDLLVDKISKVEGVDFRELQKELRLTKIRMDIDLINAAAEFGNYYIARKYYKRYVGKESPKLRVAYGNIACLKARISETPQDEVKWSLEGIDLLGTVAASTQDQMIRLSCSTKLFDVFNRLSQTLSTNPDIFDQCKADLEEKLGEKISSWSDLQSYAWKRLKNIIAKFEDDSMDCDNYEDRSWLGEVSKAYVKLAHFLRDRAQDDDQAQGDIILFVLRAMKMNSSEARQLFPCVLKQSELGGKYKEMFVEETDRIPTWMFLGWIPQLLSSVDSSKISAISKIIMRIAEAYPQSIMYPYRLSRTNYDFNDENVKLLTVRLDDLLLKDETVSKFLQALSYVSVPIVALRYYISKMLMADNLANADSIQACVKRDYFSRKQGSSSDCMQGNMYKLIDPFNKEFSKTLGTSLVELRENLKRLDRQLSGILSNEKTKYSQLLKDYCPWLANFSAETLNIELEIPGQYDGKKMPLTQHHVKLSGFCPNVSIMKSLRKPIKVTILGADTKEYPFLVKFGEDIRQDQRIEQLFGLMNDIFRSDAVCSNNGLDILTYQVIPLTSNLGIIQWINDTEPLSVFMKKSLKTEKVQQDFDNKIADRYVRWLCSGANALQVYGKSAVKYNRNKVIPFYNSLVNEIPLDLLKTSFRSLSVDVEHYIALRANYVKSYATLCVGQWLLGIGDRHLNNSLVCLRTGKVLGIDFGHAFGTGTQVLPVPELVPFRLTPHLTSPMAPLGERGLFRDCMARGARALRAHGACLLATMDVFVAEPSLDWLEHARRFEGGDAAPASWYPEVKVGQSRRKLAGANCAAIMVEDLVAGTRVPEYTDAYVKLVSGQKEFDLRARLGEENLTVEEQVDCLIDHATDPNLLGRMYVGWMPWV